jgi:gamma-glutamyltranspeptidase / glutathione hydrolase
VSALFTTRPELRGSHGMVASTHWLASAAGMATLELGGNAFDAAVATGLALQVVEPHMNGPGGEAPILLHRAGGGPLVVNGQGPAPAAATVARLRGLGLELVPGSGLLAACVPGAFDAWMLLLRDFGTLTLREVAGYAIGYAERGYPVLPRIRQTIAAVEALFRAEWTTSAAHYLGGGLPAAGSVLRNLALAATWQRLLAEAEAAGPGREAQIDAARRAWSQGFVAEAVARFCERAVLDDSGRRHRGLLAADDLAGFQASVEAPATLDHHGLTVCKTGPWGQGPVFLQQLALLEGFDLRARRPGGADLIHTVVECAKLAFADREAWYGDPRHAEVPLAGLLDPAYAADRRRLVGDHASTELRPGRPGGREPRLPRHVLDGLARPAAPAAGVAARLRGDTCHLDVVDRHGNMVAATPSGGWLQSSPVIPELGFPLGTRAQMFWLEEGLPGSLAGGRRPRTTLSPTLVLRDGEPVLAFGTPGGDQQDQWTMCAFIAHVHLGMGLQAAVDAPRWHSEHMPSSFWPRQARPGVVVVEEAIDPAVVAELRARGHTVELAPAWSLGRVCAVGRDPASGVLQAAADPRGAQAYAVGR